MGKFSVDFISLLPNPLLEGMERFTRLTDLVQPAVVKEKEREDPAAARVENNRDTYVGPESEEARQALTIKSLLG